jgi:dihydroorotase
VHFLHLSTAGSVELVRQAKAEGLPVTAEAAPHHMLLTHAEVAGYDPVFKVNPPLRAESDVAAVVAGLCDGTIDAIATDHAPHAPEAKDAPFDQAPPGMLGLQTALPIAWQVLSATLPPERLFALMSSQPAAIAGLGVTDARRAGHSAHGGPVEVGAVANLCVFDPTATTVVNPAQLASRSRNTPYAGRSFTGAVRHTVLRGEPVVVDSVAQR